MNYCTDYVNGYKVEFTTHAKERAKERFQELGIQLNDEGYVELAEAGVYATLSNKFMARYIDNFMSNRKDSRDVLVLDTTNKMVYALNMKPLKNKLVVKTLGTTYNGKWEHHMYQRICWIYENTFKFTAKDGNVTWY